MLHAQNLTAAEMLSKLTQALNEWVLSRYLRSAQGQDYKRHLVLRVVGQVLVQVGQRVGVLAEVVVDHPQLVARRQLPAQTFGQGLGGWGFRGGFRVG